MTSTRSRAARSALWSTVENAGLAFVAFSSLMIYSRFLSAADFGLFATVLSLVELLGVLVTMLFHDALVQRECLEPADRDTSFSFTLALSLVLFAACFSLAPAFAEQVRHPLASSVLRWTALSLPWLALTATIVAEQRRQLAFKALALRSLASRLLGSAAGIGLVVAGFGIWGLVAQQVLIAALGSLILWSMANDRPRLRFSARALRNSLTFGASAVSALFLNFAVKRLFVIAAGLILSSEDAGYLNMGFRAVDVLWALASAAISQVALPLLARLQSEPTRMVRGYASALQLVCLLLIPVFVGIAATSHDLMVVLFGSRWSPSAPCVTALALLAIIRTPRMLSAPMLSAAGRPRDGLLSLGVELVVVMVLLVATAASTLSWIVGIWIVRELAAAPVASFMLRRATGMSVATQLSGAGVPLLGALAMGAGVLALSHTLLAGYEPALRLLLLAPIGACLFFSFVWLADRSLLTQLAGLLTSILERPVGRGSRSDT